MLPPCQLGVLGPNDYFGDVAMYGSVERVLNYSFITNSADTVVYFVAKNDVARFFPPSLTDYMRQQALAKRKYREERITALLGNFDRTLPGEVIVKNQYYLQEAPTFETKAEKEKREKELQEEADRKKALQRAAAEALKEHNERRKAMLAEQEERMERRKQNLQSHKLVKLYFPPKLLSKIKAYADASAAGEPFDDIQTLLVTNDSDKKNERNRQKEEDVQKAFNFFEAAAIIMKNASKMETVSVSDGGKDDVKSIVGTLKPASNNKKLRKEKVEEEKIKEEETKEEAAEKKKKRHHRRKQGFWCMFPDLPEPDENKLEEEAEEDTACNVEDFIHAVRKDKDLTKFRSPRVQKQLTSLDNDRQFTPPASSSVIATPPAELGPRERLVYTAPTIMEQRKLTGRGKTRKFVFSPSNNNRFDPPTAPPKYDRLGGMRLQLDSEKTPAQRGGGRKADGEIDPEAILVSNGLAENSVAKEEDPSKILLVGAKMDGTSTHRLHVRPQHVEGGVPSFPDLTVAGPTIGPKRSVRKKSRKNTKKKERKARPEKKVQEEEVDEEHEARKRYYERMICGDVPLYEQKEKEKPKLVENSPVRPAMTPAAPKKVQHSMQLTREHEEKEKKKKRNFLFEKVGETVGKAAISMGVGEEGNPITMSSRMLSNAWCPPFHYRKISGLQESHIAGTYKPNPPPTPKDMVGVPPMWSHPPEPPKPPLPHPEMKTATAIVPPKIVQLKNEHSALFPSKSIREHQSTMVSRPYPMVYEMHRNALWANSAKDFEEKEKYDTFVNAKVKELQLFSHPNLSPHDAAVIALQLSSTMEGLSFLNEKPGQPAPVEEDENPTPPPYPITSPTASKQNNKPDDLAERLPSSLRKNSETCAPMPIKALEENLRGMFQIYRHHLEVAGKFKKPVIEAAASIRKGGRMLEGMDSETVKENIRELTQIIGTGGEVEQKRLDALMQLTGYHLYTGGMQGDGITRLFEEKKKTIQEPNTCTTGSRVRGVDANDGFYLMIEPEPPKREIPSAFLHPAKKALHEDFLRREYQSTHKMSSTLSGSFPSGYLTPSNKRDCEIKKAQSKEEEEAEAIAQTLKKQRDLRSLLTVQTDKANVADGRRIKKKTDSNKFRVVEFSRQKVLGDVISGVKDKPYRSSLLERPSASKLEPDEHSENSMSEEEEPESGPKPFVPCKLDPHLDLDSEAKKGFLPTEESKVNWHYHILETEESAEIMFEMKKLHEAEEHLRELSRKTRVFSQDALGNVGVMQKDNTRPVPRPINHITQAHLNLGSNAQAYDYDFGATQPSTPPNNQSRPPSARIAAVTAATPPVISQAATPTSPRSRPGSGRPGSGRPGSGRPGSGRPGSGRPGSGRPGSGRPGSATSDSIEPEGEDTTTATGLLQSYVSPADAEHFSKSRFYNQKKWIKRIEKERAAKIMKEREKRMISKTGKIPPPSFMYDDDDDYQQVLHGPEALKQVKYRIRRRVGVTEPAL